MQVYICPVLIFNVDVTAPSEISKFRNSLNQLLIAAIERGYHYKRKPYEMFKTVFRNTSLDVIVSFSSPQITLKPPLTPIAMFLRCYSTLCI
jgi:hypothetical protein